MALIMLRYLAIALLFLAENPRSFNPEVTLVWIHHRLPMIMTILFYMSNSCPVRWAHLVVGSIVEFGVIAFVNKRIKWNRNFNNEGFHGLPVINKNIGFTVQNAIEIGTATKEVTQWLSCYKQLRHGDPLRKWRTYLRAYYELITSLLWARYELNYELITSYYDHYTFKCERGIGLEQNEHTTSSCELVHAGDKLAKLWARTVRS